MAQRGQAVPMSGSSSAPTITVIIPGATAVPIVGLTVSWIYITQAFTLEDVAFTCQVPPTTGTIKFDVMRSSNGGTSFASMTGGTGLTFSHVTNDLKVAASCGWTGPLAAGDLLRFDILAVPGDPNYFVNMSLQIGLKSA